MRGYVLSAVVALVALAGCTPSAPSPATPPAPTASATPTPPPRQLAVGDCTGPLPSTLGGEPIETVGCDTEHTYEVFEVVRLGGDTLPSAETMRVIANNRCLPAFEAYVGVTPSHSRYNSLFLSPDEVAWETPELRQLTCLLGSPEETLSTTARDDTALFPTVGECTGPQDVPVLALEVLDCAKKHHYEVYAEKQVKGKKAPDEKELAKLISSVCVAEFKKFVGKDAASSKYEYTYFIADADLWSNVKDHRLV
ncbi:MAG: septum formation family protein, partial [Propionibacteriaceae bacterium]|nr:septum formation family protein [Propionibacteriaceae bacterium]